MSARLTQEQFVLKAIETLRKKEYKGIHTVYSGFNQAFRNYFGTDPVAATKALSEAGKIVIHGTKGGVMLYKVGEAPAARDNALKAMGLEPLEAGTRREVGTGVAA